MKRHESSPAGLQDLGREEQAVAFQQISIVQLLQNQDRIWAIGLGL